MLRVFECGTTDQGERLCVCNAGFGPFADCRIDICHVTDYNSLVIKTFADGRTRDLYETGKSRRFPPEIMRRARRRLEYIDLATGLQDLKVPPSNGFHELSGDRKGQFSISVNDQWRICFRSRMAMLLMSNSRIIIRANV